jgi:hypothetical protein
VLCDAGTVNRIKLVHAALSNPSRLTRVHPLEPYNNDNWTSDRYAAFFRDIVTTISRDEVSPRIEICGIICDNLPAQVAGLREFLSSEQGQARGIMHVPCLNHMINLVLTHVIKDAVFSDRIKNLPQVIRVLNKPESIEMVGRRCPKIIQTRWVYVVDVLGFILHHLPDVQSALLLAEQPQIPPEYGFVYLALLPLALFSHEMETRSRILGDVTPAAQEVLREWCDLMDKFEGNPVVVNCLNVLSAHFLARLGRNAFGTILTAFALTHTGRAQIRAMEQGFQTTGEIYPIPIPQFVLDMRAQFENEMNAHQGRPFHDRMGLGRIADPIHEPDPIDPDMIVDPAMMIDPHIPDDADSSGFLEFLEGEATQTPLAHRLLRNLLDGILISVQAPIGEQSQCLGYAPDRILEFFREWWTADDVGNPDSHSDEYWRQYHGRSDAQGQLAHVALRFITLGCSEADIERLLSEQRHVQGVQGTNDRTETLQARELLREPR